MKFAAVASRAALMALMAVLALMAQSAAGAGLTVTVVDRGGAAVEDAAVYAEPVSARPPPPRGKAVEIEQKERKFAPLMTVVQVGGAINFPNNDTVRHHVFSLSQSKLFELKLYAGVPANPVVFDKAGAVIVGCNIHDKMIAYIRVVDTPWFGKTDARGQVRIDGLPDGEYRLKAWHHQLANLDVPAEQMVAARGDTPALTLRLEMKAGAR